MKRIKAALLICISVGSISAQETSVREEYIPFDTYSFSDPDPVAQPGKIFPYFRFDRYSYTPVVKKHKMIVLENKWIKVWIAPEIGGKIWGALDKKNNHYFIYFNKVVKFRDIAMRGPWTSGGIEHNFGAIGHAPTVATPVNYHYQVNSDGSVSCFVGMIDLPSRTEWRVEVRLPKDKAWFETISYWHNPTDLKSSLYHWQTAAANGTDDLRFYFPGKAAIGHDGIAIGWPVMRDGRDISFYRNNNYNSSHSYHVLGEYTDWFAGYYHDSNTGFGHWTRHPVKPGKKIWIWSLAGDGAIWEKLLTDPEKGNTQYIEMQTGLLFNQESDNSTFSPFKHYFFEPGAVETFKELWFPLSDLSGVKSISKEGILNLEKTITGYSIQFQALSYLQDKLQVIDLSGTVLYDFPVSLEPEEVLRESISLKNENVKIKLVNGELMYDMSGNKTNVLDRPQTIQEDLDWESVYGLYTRGIEKSRQRLYEQARDLLNNCIRKDPWYFPAITSLAEIDFRQLKYEDAEKKLLKVISFNTYDPDANFLYGVILTRKKEYNKARDAFGVTLRSPQYKAVSRNKLAIIALLENRPEEAWEYISEGLRYDGIDKNLCRTAAVTARLRGDKESYEELLQRLLEMDPLNHFAAFEQYYSSRDAEKRIKLTSKITGELSYETYIELALWYYNTGLLNEALAVMELCPEAPVADYLTSYLAFLLDDNVKSRIHLQRAVSTDDRLVFPYRDEYAEILAWADSMQNSWKTKYYCALLYWSMQQREIAAKYFNECGDLPQSYSFYLTRGKFLNEDKSSSGEADYLKGLQYGGDKWRPYHMLYNFYVSNNMYDKALNITGQAIKLFDDTYTLWFDHAMSLLYNGRYEESVRILEKIQILPHEGAGYGRTAWKTANLLNALYYYSSGSQWKALISAEKAYQWPENLGVGRPYNVDERAEDFIQAMILEKTGNKKGSLRLFEKVADFNGGKPAGNGSVNYLSLLAMKILGRQDQADRFYDLWMEFNRNEFIERWTKLNLENKKDQAAGLIKSLPGEGEKTPWNPPGTDADFRLVHEIVQHYNHMLP